MKPNWQEIAEQHAARIRELEELASDLQNALEMATGGGCALNHESWKAWVHEKDCPGYDSHDEPCRCDGKYIIEVVEEALAKRI